MSFKVISSRALAICLSALLVNVPQFLSAQTTNNTAATPSTQASPTQNSQSQTAQPSQSQVDQQTTRPQTSAVPNPSQGPLQPVPTTRPADNNAVPPDAPSEVQRSVQEQEQQQEEQQAAPAAAPAQPLQHQSPPPPLGTATAREGVTRGGLASRPAGEAIAPAKQHQVRSLVIKVALIAAAAAAVGTVVGLTRATSSIPPGAH